ncbi:hypothetical protein K504DRAFT_461701 [Pleomassaria siparia CBS 279.74]|uniref:Uncharacterized protein n=1 Tax=Pleomassaria siparia CBS 279.74 TaxID=1314801 RepID=A0A6G1KL51_9PLEO|nr:hypothetical protein K504DRAFT_461701 [Pleomassaria siparia CBS 279.74]
MSVQQNQNMFGHAPYPELRWPSSIPRPQIMTLARYNALSGNKVIRGSFLRLSPASTMLDSPHNTLTGLLVEILKNIASYLPISSVVALTLTCKLLTKIIGTTSWYAVRNNSIASVERLRLLKLLDRENPLWWTENYLRYPITNVNGQVKPPHFSSDNGYFKVLVTEFNQGSTDVTASITDPHGHLVHQASIHLLISAKIVAGFLLLRCVYKLSSDRIDRLEFHNLIEANPDICRHTGTRTKNNTWSDDTLATFLVPTSYQYFGSSWHGGNNKKLTLDDVSGSKGTKFTGNCSRCFTDYEVTSASEDPEANLVLTTYHNLGIGKLSSLHDNCDHTNESWTAFSGGAKCFGKAGPHNTKKYLFGRTKVGQAFEAGQADPKSLGCFVVMDEDNGHVPHFFDR